MASAPCRGQSHLLVATSCLLEFPCSFYFLGEEPDVVVTDRVSVALEEDLVFGFSGRPPPAPVPLTNSKSSWILVPLWMVVMRAFFTFMTPLKRGAVKWMS